MESLSVPTPTVRSAPGSSGSLLVEAAAGRADVVPRSGCIGTAASRQVSPVRARGAPAEGCRSVGQRPCAAPYVLGRAAVVGRAAGLVKLPAQLAVGARPDGVTQSRRTSRSSLHGLPTRIRAVGPCTAVLGPAVSHVTDGELAAEARP